MIPFSASGFGYDTEFDQCVDVASNAPSTDTCEPGEFRSRELLFRVDAKQGVDDEVYAFVLTEVQSAR